MLTVFDSLFWDNDKMFKLYPFDANNYRGYKYSGNTEVKTYVDNSDTATTIMVALPGYKRDDVEVTFENSELCVSVKNTDDKKYFKSNYKKVWKLESYHDYEEIVANMENGVLTVTIPYQKKDRTKLKRIEIK